MRFCLILLFLTFADITSAQSDTLRRNNFFPVGGCPPLPDSSVVSFMVTLHSSEGSGKVYYEKKVWGNDLPADWVARIQALPRGSTVYYSQAVTIKNGERIILPVVKYIMQ
jgi:hypothetical protein